MNINIKTDANMSELANLLIYICGPLAGQIKTQKQYNNLYITHKHTLTRVNQQFIQVSRMYEIKVHYQQRYDRRAE